MSCIFRIILFGCFLLVPWQVANAQGGKVILDIKEDKRELIDYPNLYKEYIEEVKEFDKKYPGNKIEEDFTDDVLSLHPDYSDEEAESKTVLLRLGIKGFRSYQFWKEKIQDFLLENEIPLQFDDDEYEMGGAVAYQKTDKPLIIKDFKKVVAYSDSQRDKAAIEDKLARDSGRMPPYERKQIMKKALLAGDWKTLLSYGLFDGTALDDKRGIGEWNKTEELQARLLSTVKTIVKPQEQEEQSIKGALQLYTMPGWFLLNREYRGNPGFHVDFTKSENLETIELNWPLPRRYFSNLKDSFSGYLGLTTIPFKATIKDATKELVLIADISAGMCNEKGCKLVKLHPALKLLPGDKEEESSSAVSLRLITEQSPKEQSEDLKLERLVVEDGKPQVLRLEAYSEDTPSSFDAFIEGGGPEEFLPPLVRIDGHRIIARFVPVDLQAKLEGREFSVVAGTAPNMAVRQSMKAQKASLVDTEENKLNLRWLWLAFLGGLLLNVMPCVFPVLALKVMSFSGFGALNLEQIRKTFCANLLGIASSFVLLIIGLISLKELGKAIGWGMQFQSMGFLTVMIFVISGFIAHLWGLIQLPGPGFWENIINRQKSEFMIQFLSGAFVVLLSTSCTAPYLGTVLGLALAGTPWEIALTLSCVGLGLAAPYILFALFPAAAFYMPRPGKWLRWINLLMFAFLFATLAWLLSLLAAQKGGVIWWQFSLFIGAFWLLLLFRKLAFNTLEEQEQDADIYNKVRQIFNIGTIILSVGLIVWAANVSEISKPKEKQDFSIVQEYKQIEQHLNEGRMVLLKIGADWCLSCKYNDFAAFDAPQVKQLVEKYGIVEMTINWTDYDEEVLSFMQKFGRSGLPFYVIFTPQIPSGMVLPEILNEQDLRRIIEALAN